MRSLGFVLAAVALSSCAASSPMTDMGALRANAEAGDRAAMFSLGMRYDSGVQVPQDRKEAAKWYLRSAEAGLPEAQNSIGTMYQAGDGVEKDLGKALAWYEKASERGHLEAIHNQAFLYDEGIGVPQDNNRAIKLYTHAAERGFVKSMLNLGIMYSQGDGVPLNNIEAYKWLDLARFYTQTSNDTRLKWHVRGQLDELKKKMSQADIAAAERLTREWDTTHRAK